MNMERILLIEPNYKNKYPPIGLMKIASYYKNKGDFVMFHKGLLSKNEVVTFDKVLITTLFTFDFDMCIQTIKYYISLLGISNVWVGGVAASIMPENFQSEIPGLNVLTRQLVSSESLGYADQVNIDILELDYDILWDISYEYPSSDSYFIYSTRGCPRKCSFCAVRKLEPEFYDCNNINNQISTVESNFGIKKQLLVMDNNILHSEHFTETVDSLVDLGFGKDNNKIKKNNSMKYYLMSLEKRIKEERNFENLFLRIKKELINLKFVRINKEDAVILQEILEKLKQLSKDEFAHNLVENKNYIVNFFERYHHHKITRYIDFNQGLDARLLTDEKAKKMAELALKPCRIAFDNLNIQNDYFDAMGKAVKYGIRHFSNYLLYNYNERPEELWKRIYLNIEFCTNHADDKLKLFSFPMKYASIYHTDRSYVGAHWNRKYLRAINVILNVTSGVVAKEEDFFLRAFGASEEKFLTILAMPDNFIRYRDYFEKKGFMSAWKNSYKRLTEEEKNQLILILEKMILEPDVIQLKYCKNINNVLQYYSISKKKVENNEKYYFNFLLKQNLSRN